MHFVLAICHSLGFPDDQLYEEISRVLKPGGTVVIQKSLHPDEAELDTVEILLMLQWMILYFFLMSNMLS